MIRTGSLILVIRFVIVRMYHSFLDVLFRFHASVSIRYDAQIFATVRKLSL